MSDVLKKKAQEGFAPSVSVTNEKLEMDEVIEKRLPA